MSLCWRSSLTSVAHMTGVAGPDYGEGSGAGDVHRFVEELFYEMTAQPAAQRLALAAGSRNFTEVHTSEVAQSRALTPARLPVCMRAGSAHSPGSVQRHAVTVLMPALPTLVCTLQADYEMLSALDSGVRRRALPISEADIAALPTHAHRAARKVQPVAVLLGCVHTPRQPFRHAPSMHPCVL